MLRSVRVARLPQRPSTKVRVKTNPSDVTALSAGAPQGRVLSPLVTLPGCGLCAALFSSDRFMKFAEMTRVGLINKKAAAAHRGRVIPRQTSLLMWKRKQNERDDGGL